MIGSRHHLGLVTIWALTLAGCADSFEPSRIGSFATEVRWGVATAPDLRGEREQQ